MGTRTKSRTSKQGPLPAIELQILLQLARGPGHGYRMMQSIAAETDGSFCPGPGTLYVALRRLTERGLIEPADAAGGRTRRQEYRLTAAGRTMLDDQLEMLDSILSQARRAGWWRARKNTT